MLRGIGYVVARRDSRDPEEPNDWALVIEAVVRGMMARFTGLYAAVLRQRLHGKDSASARRSR